MTKSLANRLYLKQRLYSYKIQEEKGLEDQMEEFTKILDVLENIEIELEEEDKALILLNALPRSYENFRDAMLYGRDQTITLDEVQSAIRSKELQRKTNGYRENKGESLMAREASGKKSFTHKRYKSRSRSPGNNRDKGKKDLKCFICHKQGHFKRDCPDRYKKHPGK